jgi:hypothetical protein
MESLFECHFIESSTSNICACRRKKTCRLLALVERQRFLPAFNQPKKKATLPQNKKKCILTLRGQTWRQKSSIIHHGRVKTCSPFSNFENGFPCFVFYFGWMSEFPRIFGRCYCTSPSKSFNVGIFRMLGREILTLIIFSNYSRSILITDGAEATLKIDSSNSWLTNLKFHKQCIWY